VSALEQRREQVRAGRQNIEAIGYPVGRRDQASQLRTPATQTPAATPQRTKSGSSEKASSEYDVALSFAGEDRTYVEDVARILKAAGVRVFYDKFETVQLWGRNLADHLGEVYGKRSRFVVIFIS